MPDKTIYAKIETIAAQIKAAQIKKNVDLSYCATIAEKYRHDKTEDTRRKYVEVYHETLTTAVRRALALGLNQSRGKRILDIGTGIGFFPLVCQHFGHHCEAIDKIDEGVYRDMIRYLGIQRTTAGIYAYQPFPVPGPFDVITAYAIVFCRGSAARGTFDVLWGAEEWEYFLDTALAELSPNGRIALHFNQLYENYQLRYTPEIRAVLEERHAQLEGAVAVIDLASCGGSVTPDAYVQLSSKAKMGGKQPKLSEKQQRELARLHATGEYSISDLAEVYVVSEPTVYRTLKRLAVGTKEGRMSEKVDFFIVGAMKAGTASLRDMLRQHPDVDMPQDEINYFNKSAHYEQGRDWYHGHFDFSRAGVLRGNKCPAYGSDLLTPPKMAEYNPAAKLVWILRDPTRRLVSNFHHAKRRKPRVGLSIEESQENAEALVANNHDYAYLYRSQYDRHLKEFLKHFNHDRHHVIIFEELIADPGAHAAALAGWLGIDPAAPMELPHSNNTSSSVRLGFPVAPELLGQMHDLLEPTVAYVEEFLGRKIPAWREEPKLSEKRQRELGRMHATGEYSISDLAEVYVVSEPTVYRTLERLRAKTGS